MNHIFHSISKIIVLGSVVFFVVTCSQYTAFAAKAKEPFDSTKVTYKADIAPIMERSCAPCHFPKKDGKKKPLDTYTTVKGKIEKILDRVQLPPDHRKHMPYKNATPGFSAEEIQMLKNWARDGFIES
ncbi:hypothetical protein Oweho_0666 [Owenweeksia hongkongensis DSM 17368]|uniref:Cytochrome c domain-containing protein n=1 Tax=Owenweeksia hongkongensis (strain DSM 17368 / CIP 108786 / JCM 12287 / NRRL B-23963 / UST20020801) TaxID=926562 RepID=G8R109_OWEHD|nr:hypothetical protein [Owenweeksia hongkongensis]AEV31680.1 hypothetical protein Oweho_0666 [Owenweeksia hongkongensis DSM 17368]